MISGMDVMVNWVERARMLAVAAVLALGTAQAEKTVVFFTPWSNTNAVLFVGGDSVATMTPLENYCGWFKATVDAPAEGFGVYFKQTVGLNYVGAEGMVVAFIFGVIALKWLMNFVQKGKFQHFAWYVWAVGILGLIFL